MGLLAPLFIAVGLLALAVPVIVHLINRERSETVVFPSLMFLRKIPYRSVRRQKIRHWLLFVLRCLALLLLASAFARPFLSGASEAAAALGGGRELVVLLDRSYSMGYGDHWRRALAAAQNAVDGVGPADRATVILFSSDAQAANRTTSDRVALRAAVDTAKPGSGITRYAPALKLARQFLEESPLPRRAAVVISDFQRAGWSAEEVTRLPAGTDITTVNVGTLEPANVSVAGVSFQRDRQAGRERVVVSARLSNRSAAPVKRVPVKLELGGREIQTVNSGEIAPNGAIGVTFAAFNLPDGASRGTVRAGPDNLLADNAFYFVLSPDQAVSVLLLEPVGGSADLSLYLRRALSVGDRPPFRVESRRVNQLTRSDLAGRSVVVSLDAGIPAGEAGRALAEFVGNGGGLLVALGERSSAAQFGPEAAALLPARPGAVIERGTAAGGRLAQVDVGHAVFEPFSAPRSGDFSSARFFRYRRIGIDTSATPAILARFDDGTPALLERRVGRGTVLLWTSSLDNFWTDLPLQPVYLPFVHQLAKRAAGYTEAKPWFNVGQAADLADARTAAAGAAGVSERENLVAEAPSGRRVVIPTGTSRALSLQEQGFYEVRRPGESGTGSRVVAANLDLAEADLTPLDPQEFAAAVRPQSATLAGGAGEPETVTSAERERRQAIWWYLLMVASLLLVTETVLSNRLSTAKATT